MRKSARLDQVLMSLGLVDEDQVRRALKRQRIEGGRFGTNLVELGSITERELLLALAEQFNLTMVEPDEDTLSPELVQRMPPAIVYAGRALPLAWNEGQKVLTLAVTDPGDDDLIDEVKASFGARAVRLRLAPDSVMAAVGKRLREGGDGPDEPEPERESERPDTPSSAAIALPELFDGEEEKAPTAEMAVERKAVLVTRRGSLRSFLPPLFEREGCTLIAVSDEDEAAAAFARDDLEAVLVTPEMRETLSEWIRTESVPSPGAEVMAFTSVAESLLANPVSYTMTAGSLKRAVEALADSRASRFEAAIPYGLVASDAMELGRRMGLRRVVVDALHMAAHLLLPAPFEKASGSVCWEQPFEEFRVSLELARRIRFPWRLDALLLAAHALFSRRTQDGKDDATGRESPARWGDETLLAARILAVCWYRHICVLRTADEGEEALIALRADLRREMSPLASSQVVEAYLDLIRQRGGPRTERDEAKILLVGSQRLEEVLAPALRRVGRATFTTRTLAEAQVIMDRSTPAALIIDGSEFPRDVAKFSRVTKLDGSALIFVVTDASDPSMAMSLLEVGIDDVFAPPHEFDLMAARISRAIQSRARVVSREETPPGQFSSDFEVFSFLDLVQMLSQGLKTVRIDLTRTADERAVLFMKKGRIIHASSGSLMGPEAVYEVIRWEDDGEFTVRQEDPVRFPEATIEVATDSLLMEGVRLLDESKIQ